MKWEGQGIILSLHRFSEHAGIVSIFTEDGGIISGMMRGAMSQKQRPILEPGNLLEATWSARLAEQLGTLQCECLQPIAAYFMHDATKLLALQSALHLTEKMLIERDAHPALYRSLWSLLQTLKFGGDWPRFYVEFELCLLAECGFGLELSTCAATGQRHDLTHVSPKSGRAISSIAAFPYKERLLPLPDFLQPKPPSSSQNIPIHTTAILDGMRLTGYFIEQRIMQPNGWTTPPIRQRLQQKLEQRTLPTSVQPIQHKATIHAPENA